jgi:hypothetical protein
MHNSLIPSPSLGAQGSILRGNPIRIFRVTDGVPNRKKVRGTISHRHSNRDILSNVRVILEDRIRVKAAKCAFLLGRMPVWLALRDDYCLADSDAYKSVLSSLEHPFEKVLLVNDDGSVVSLLDATR